MVARRNKQTSKQRRKNQQNTPQKVGNILIQGEDVRLQRDKDQIFNFSEQYTQAGRRTLREVAEYANPSLCKPGREPLQIEDFDNNPLSLMLFRAERYQGLRQELQNANATRKLRTVAPPIGEVLVKNQHDYTITLKHDPTTPVSQMSQQLVDSLALITKQNQIPFQLPQSYVDHEHNLGSPCFNRTKKDIKTLNMNDIEFKFRAQDIPTQHRPYYWSRDISKLLYEWDNRENATLRILNCSIPPKYYDQVYKYHLPDTWETMKKQHSEAKLVFAFASTYSCRESFLQEYRDASWTQILKDARRKRKEDDLEYVKKAKTEYPGSDFTTYFSYRKGNKQFQYQSNNDIARTYRRLHSIQSVWD